MKRFKSEKQEIKLYCLPFAGGNALSYRDFQACVDSRILVKPLELAGRGKRIREALFTCLEAMADDVLQQLRDDLNGGAYAIYGHSMGALLGYLLARRLADAALPAPLHLFLSGRRAPSADANKLIRHLLPKDSLIEHINKLGGLHPDILEEAELMDFFEPIFRADFEAVETHVHSPRPPLDIPISVLYGLADNETAGTDLSAWQRETRQPIVIKEFPGGHFFILEHLPQLGRLFSETLLA
ncbi:MAG: thioesterase [Gammaproteobacteria bacterium]|nr:thioesterase [Gammaproteobacteria bacterium]